MHKNAAGVVCGSSALALAASLLIFPAPSKDKAEAGLRKLSKALEKYGIKS